MQSKNKYIYSLVAPLMILIAIIGINFRGERKNNFYVPMGCIGIYLIVDKEFERRLKRKNILKKVKFFQKN